MMQQHKEPTAEVSRAAVIEVVRASQSIPAPRSTSWSTESQYVIISNSTFHHDKTCDWTRERMSAIGGKSCFLGMHEISFHDSMVDWHSVLHLAVGREPIWAVSLDTIEALPNERKVISPNSISLKSLKPTRTAYSPPRDAIFGAPQHELTQLDTRCWIFPDPRPKSLTQVWTVQTSCRCNRKAGEAGWNQPLKAQRWQTSVGLPANQLRARGHGDLGWRDALGCYNDMHTYI